MNLFFVVFCLIVLLPNSMSKLIHNRCKLTCNNLSLTEREDRTGEYWPEVVAVRTEPSEVRTKTTEGQYSPVRLELARLVSSLLYGTRAMLVLNFTAFENKKNTRLMTVSTETVRMAKFRPRKNQSERSDLPCRIIKLFIKAIRLHTCMQTNNIGSLFLCVSLLVSVVQL